MMLPTQRDRRSVDRSLRLFFALYGAADFRRAITTICRFYDLRPPTVGWYEYLDWGKGAGRTYENGRIHLVHPENWKKGRKYNTMKQWIHTVHHEMGHYLFWADAERKADLFADRMMHGLSHEYGLRLRAAKPPVTLIRMVGTRRSVGRRRSGR
jgi:hypothetical protein